MILNRKIELINDVYHAAVGLADSGLTDAETTALARLGDLTIEVGGNFSDAGLSTDFDLYENSKLFPSQFPIKRLFDRNDLGDANERAQTWEAEIADRIDTAMTALLATDVGVLKDETTTY